jgi:hypothetical protein
VAGYRVTRYDPALRREDGSFSRATWTSISDVGRVFEGHELSLQEYLEAEQGYVLALRAFLGVVGLSCLRVQDLKVNRVSSAVPGQLVEEMQVQLRSLINGAIVCDEDLDSLVRLALREALWCRLAGDQGFYVHFGHDYYMYIGGPIAAVPPVPEGIFVETFDSPYVEEAAEE